MSNRLLKKEVRELLLQDDLIDSLDRLSLYPGRKVINPLFSFLYSPSDTLKWHAVSAMGHVTAGLAKENMESARVIMRRLIWNLNDESGGIGWGSPEAMGDIMACSMPVAREYAKILVSYILPHGNYLEHEVLQRGLLWGLYRLSSVHPELTTEAVPFVRSYLQSGDPIHRGLAACFAGAVRDKKAILYLRNLDQQNQKITVYTDFRLTSQSVSHLAQIAIDKIEVHKE